MIGLFAHFSLAPLLLLVFGGRGGHGLLGFGLLCSFRWHGEGVCVVCAKRGRGLLERKKKINKKKRTMKRLVTGTVHIDGGEA